ncbi:MAG: ATP-binding protein, partial [Thermoleophilaceae bacterium]
RLVAVDLLVLDDFALQAYDHQETADLYELVVERHRRASTVVVSNREPKEWLAMMADPLLAQSAVDRLLNAAYELVLEGDSYRRHQKPQSGRDDSGAEALRRPQRPAAAAVAMTALTPQAASAAPRRIRARERGARKPQDGGSDRP